MEYVSCPPQYHGQQFRSHFTVVSQGHRLSSQVLAAHPSTVQLVWRQPTAQALSYPRANHRNPPLLLLHFAIHTWPNPSPVKVNCPLLSAHAIGGKHSQHQILILSFLPTPTLPPQRPALYTQSWNRRRNQKGTPTAAPP